VPKRESWVIATVCAAAVAIGVGTGDGAADNFPVPVVLQYSWWQCSTADF
jgi:hypothetical protein